MNDSLNNTDRDSGYTLPELLLTLALTALLILAGSYGWRQHQSARQLASSAHHLMDFIVRQQWHAAWGNRRCRITAVVGERAESGRAAPHRQRGALRPQQSGGASAGGGFRPRPGAAMQRAGALGGDPVMLTGWAGGTGTAVAQLPAVTLPAVADAEAAPASVGEGWAGFSLPELLAALAAYSVLLTVALHLFPALHRGAEGAIRQLQLMRQLDLYALNMVKDLRRAGFSPQGKAGRVLWIGRYLREPAGSCLVVGYAYYARSDASGHLVNATFGYRLRRGALETQRDVSDCQGDGWEKVFNSDELTVTRLQFTALAGGALRIHLAATARRRPDIGYAVTQVVARRNL